MRCRSRASKNGRLCHLSKAVVRGMVWKFTLHWNLKNLRTNFNTTIWKLETISTVPIGSVEEFRRLEDDTSMESSTCDYVPSSSGCKHALFPRVQQASAGCREETSSSLRVLLPTEDASASCCVNRCTVVNSVCAFLETAASGWAPPQSSVMSVRGAQFPRLKFV